MPRSLRLFLCMSLFCLIFVTVSSAQEESKPVISEVEFQGLKSLQREDLLRQMESRPGTRLDVVRLREDLKRISERVRSAEVRREGIPGGVRLVFVVEENPTLSDIRFIGNSELKTDHLRKVVRARPGDVISRQTLRESRDGVQKEYRQLGYSRAAVQADLVPVSPEEVESDRVILQIQIDEGPQIKVDDLLIDGNEHFSNTRLGLSIESGGSWLFFKNYFDEDAFERDLAKIREMYIGDGFFDVRVVRGPFEYDEEGRTLTPRIVISEGERYEVGSIEVVGARVFQPEEVSAPFQKLRGKSFDRKKFAFALQKVRGLYGDAGYLTTEIQESFEFDRETAQVNARLDVQESPRIQVGDILLEKPALLATGPPSWFARLYDRIAPPVKDEVIRREVLLEPGAVYSRRVEEQSEERLLRLGVFETVDIESRGTDASHVRDAVVSVQESGATGNLYFGIGYSESSGVYGYGGYRERNVGGNADELRVDGLVGTRSSRANIAFFNRHLGDSDMSLSNEVYYGTARRPGFDEKRVGIDNELTVPFGEPARGEDQVAISPWKAGIGARAEYIETDEADYDPDADFNRSYPVAALRAKIIHDTVHTERLDGPNYYPVSGHLASLGLEGGYADGPLAKLTGGYEWYHRLGEKLVFASDFEAGVMPVDADEIGPTERFYLGGAEDLRGFQFRRAGPHDAGDDEVPLGGAPKMLLRNELRYPIFEVLTGLVFLDAGMLDDEPFQYGGTRASTGVGFRLKVQAVEMGVDFALPLLTGDDDATRFFHFIIQSQFGP